MSCYRAHRANKSLWKRKKQEREECYTFIGKLIERPNKAFAACSTTRPFELSNKDTNTWTPSFFTIYSTLWTQKKTWKKEEDFLISYPTSTLHSELSRIFAMTPTKFGLVSHWREHSRSKRPIRFSDERISKWRESNQKKKKKLIYNDIWIEWVWTGKILLWTCPYLEINERHLEAFKETCKVSEAISEIKSFTTLGISCLIDLN